MRDEKTGGLETEPSTLKAARAERLRVDAEDNLDAKLDEEIRALILAELIDCVAEVGNYAPSLRHGESCALRFGRYLDCLESAEAEYAAHLLVQSALGQLEATRWYTRSSLDVLLELARSDRAALFIPARARIERMFDDPAALMRWARPKRERGTPRGRAFVGTWAYAIGLWEVLSALHSTQSSRALTQILRLHRVWRQASVQEESSRRKQRNVTDEGTEPMLACLPCNWMRRSLAW